MLIYGSQLIGLSVGSLEENRMVAKVKKILINKNSAIVVGFIIHLDGLFGPNLFLSTSDIVSTDRNGVVVNKKDNFVATEEVLLAKKIIDDRFNLFGLPARVARSKKRLGKVSDFIVDTQSFQIIKFCIKGLWEDRIFPLSEVRKITNKEIIFEKDVEKITAKKALTEEVKI